MADTYGLRDVLKVLLTGALLLTPGLTVYAADYPETTQALQERYLDEVEAHLSYTAFSEKALADGYPNSAYLFKSLATSEGIHAHNFKRILDALGAEVPAEQPQARPVETTRYNIMHATGVETDEIDNEYPAILARIKPENHQDAITNLTWAWEAEKQHRKLLGRMQDAARNWFKFLIAHIEGEVVDYHVCKICGSTLVERPAEHCPICNNPASHYRMVPYVAAERPETEEDY
ncbi:MAG: rubrerythrin family protein [Gammaproteobacteria bacterium]|nr:MAG: rubrerythrin family protein [Gammaproteobacteria bacterium]